MTSGNDVRVASIAVAVPQFSITQEDALGVMRTRYAGVVSKRSMGVLEKVFRHPSIGKRHFAFDEPSRLFGEDPDQRVERFTAQAVALAEQAAQKALADAGCNAGDVAALVVNTCTGYVCPGLSTYLIERMGLRRDVQAFDLVGSGCGGAVPNLVMARSLLNGITDGIVLSIAVEICSATFQMGDNISLLVSNALFGDGAAAVVLWKERPGLRLVGGQSKYIPEYREDIRFVHKNGQLHNQLSLRLPALAGKAVATLIDNLLAAHGLETGRIAHWAFHSGGENVIKTVQEELRLSAQHMAVTRAVLADYGNMSSPTSLFALKRIVDNGVAAGDYCLMAAFGAGFSAHAYLFQAS